jgi:hypothetical protein
MLGQFLEVPDEEVEVLEGVVLDDPDVLLVLFVLLVVAASAASAPPAIRPLVRAPTAITFLRRNLMVAAPFAVLPVGGDGSRGRNEGLVDRHGVDTTPGRSPFLRGLLRGPTALPRAPVGTGP